MNAATTRSEGVMLPTSKNLHSVHSRVQRGGAFAIGWAVRFLTMWAFMTPASAADTVTEQVTFQSQGYALSGCVTRPNSEGRFPAIIYNHGSEKDPPPCGPPALVTEYTNAGLLFFTFQRRGHGASAGPYVGDLQKEIKQRLPIGPARQRQIVQLHEEYNKDVVDGVAYLLSRPDVDASRVVMTGVSFGGIQTVLSAEKGLGLRAFIAFAPAAQNWFNPLLRQRLAQAVRRARAPIFLAQAQNDYSTGPIQELGPIVQAKAPPNTAILYPPFGTTPKQGHGGFAVRGGVPVWRNDVLAFLDAVLK
jgi:dienelactone hydrolase